MPPVLVSSESLAGSVASGSAASGHAVSRGDMRTILWEGDHRWLRSAIERVLDQGDDRVVVVDCRNVEVLHSEQLSMLIQLRMWLQSRGCTLRMDQVRPAVLEVLQLTRLDRMLEVQGVAQV